MITELEKIKSRMISSGGIAILSRNVENKIAKDCRIIGFNCFPDPEFEIKHVDDICSILDYSRAATSELLKCQVIAFFVPNVSLGAYINTDIEKIDIGNNETVDLIPALIKLNFPHK